MPTAICPSWPALLVTMFQPTVILLTRHLSSGPAPLDNPSVLSFPLSPAPPPLPRYPASPDDNQYHLQALRHLYVLAVQRRGVDAVDVDTGESLFVPLSVSLQPSLPVAASRLAREGGNTSHHDTTQCESSYATPPKGRSGSEDGGERGQGIPGGDPGRGGDVVTLVTPCILPDLGEVSKISVRSPRYFPVELDLARHPEIAVAMRRCCRIYVKRRVGHLSYKNVRAAGL